MRLSKDDVLSLFGLGARLFRSKRLSAVSQALADLTASYSTVQVVKTKIDEAARGTGELILSPAEVRELDAFLDRVKEIFNSIRR